MTDFVTDRNIITSKILASINKDYSDSDHAYAMSRWWKNIRASGGLGLTELGNMKFVEAGLEYWDFELENDVGMHLIKFNFLLDRKIPCPHILLFSKKNNIIRIYDSRIAVTIGLWGGIDKLLDHYLGK